MATLIRATVEVLPGDSAEQATLIAEAAMGNLEPTVDPATGVPQTLRATGECATRARSIDDPLAGQGPS
jgi:hypothetical protein